MVYNEEWQVMGLNWSFAKTGKGLFRDCREGSTPAINNCSDFDLRLLTSLRRQQRRDFCRVLVSPRAAHQLLLVSQVTWDSRSQCSAAVRCGAVRAKKHRQTNAVGSRCVCAGALWDSQKVWATDNGRKRKQGS